MTNASLVGLGWLNLPLTKQNNGDVRDDTASPPRGASVAFPLPRLRSESAEVRLSARAVQPPQAQPVCGVPAAAVFGRRRQSAHQAPAFRGAALGEGQVGAHVQRPERKRPLHRVGARAGTGTRGLCRAGCRGTSNRSSHQRARQQHRLPRDRTEAPSTINKGQRIRGHHSARPGDDARPQGHLGRTAVAPSSSRRRPLPAAAAAGLFGALSRGGPCCRR